MKELLTVAGGGAVGAVARYLVYVAAGHLLGTAFPYGTLIVNIVGSFIMGVLIEGAALAWTISPQMQLFLAVGILGAFTTFSTFSLDVAVLYERGQMLRAAIYIMTSVVFSIGALFAGLYAVRHAFGPAL